MFKVTKTSAKRQHCPSEIFMKAVDSGLPLQKTAANLGHSYRKV